MSAASWTIFNGAGAVECRDCTLEDVRDCMTPERFERGWIAVQSIVIRTQEQLAALTPTSTAPNN
jgi:hypothetical protein